MPKYNDFDLDIQLNKTQDTTPLYLPLSYYSDCYDCHRLSNLTHCIECVATTIRNSCDPELCPLI